MIKLNFKDEIKRVKEVKNFSEMFSILVEIENKNYSIEEYDYKVWDEIKRESIQLFNNHYQLFFETNNNGKDSLINFFYLSLKLEPNKIKS
jgi:hypothetical protein